MSRPLEITRQFLALLLVAGCALALGACGIKGPLEPPAAASETGTAKSAEAGASGENTAAKPKPHEPFILDGIIR